MSNEFTTFRTITKYNSITPVVRSGKHTKQQLYDIIQLREEHYHDAYQRIMDKQVKMYTVKNNKISELFKANRQLSLLIYMVCGVNIICGLLYFFL